MAETIWQRESCSPERDYMLGKDPYVKYDNQDEVISVIMESLRAFVHAEPAVRLTLDSPLSNSERAILAIPFESDQDLILRNFAQIIYQSLIGYYFSAEPKTSHFGLANLTLEGNVTSLLRREMEKLIDHFQNRPDIAGRLLKNVALTGKFEVPNPGDVFLSDTLKKGLDIHVGYRIFALGSNVNCTRIFIPMNSGEEIINHIYYNLERLLHQSFVTYDETGDQYLKITETLIFKEMETVLKRARNKQVTRKKILNNLQFNTILIPDPQQDQQLTADDSLYDLLNQIQDEKLKAASNHSRELYASFINQFDSAIKVGSSAQAKEIEQSLKRGSREKEAAETIEDEFEDGSPQQMTKNSGRLTRRKKATHKPEIAGSAPSAGSERLARRVKTQPSSDNSRLARREKTKVPLPKKRGIRVPPRRAKARVEKAKAPV